MIARAALPFTLRHFLDRVGLGSMRERSGPTGWLRLNRLQGLFAALGDWSSGSDLARRIATLSGDQGIDEFGAGWYAQICRCRHCGRQGMRVWPLAWW
jgi:hypothetical protein